MQAIKKNEEYNEKELAPLPSELCYAATVDIYNAEQEITELMIRRACEQMEAQQQFPFAAGPSKSA
jgi:hypothetical protein